MSARGDGARLAFGPVSAAAGLGGNLDVESDVLPQRVEGSAEATPMRARNFEGHWRDFTAEAVMRRSFAARTGPRLPGVGLAQWTRAARRAGLFTQVFRGVVLGPRVLFDFEAQIDSLVGELQSPGFHAVQAVLTGAGATLENASDAVVYDFDIPGSILDGNRQKRPRTHPAVIQVFNRRRQRGHQALQAFQQAGP